MSNQPSPTLQRCDGISPTYIAIPDDWSHIETLGSDEARKIELAVVFYSNQPYPQNSPTWHLTGWIVQPTTIINSQALKCFAQANRRAWSEQKTMVLGAGLTSFSTVELKPAWICLAENGKSSLTIEEVRGILDAISDQFFSGDTIGISAALKDAKVSDMSVDAMVAIARCTAPLRESLEDWSDFIIDCRNEFAARSVDIKPLRGLV